MFDPKTRILIVDDMMTMRKIVGKACKEIGMTDLIEASDGNIAWQKINEPAAVPIGLVISDWNMPNCSGLEFLRKLRADPILSKTPFLLVTAEAEKTQVVEALKAGVDGYLVKPFTSDQLKEQLASVAAKRIKAVA